MQPKHPASDITGEQQIMMQREKPETETDWLKVLSKEPLRVEAWQALRHIYLQAQDRERTYAMCAALAFLGHADAEELEFLRQLRPARLLRSTVQLTDDAWEGCIYRSDLSRFVGSVLGAICPAVSLLKAAEHKAFGLRRGARRDLATDETLFARIFRYVAGVVGVPCPEAYLRPDEMVHLMLANTREGKQVIPSVIVGQGMLNGQSEKELCFRSAVFLAKLRPEHYLRMILPTQAEMRVAFCAAVRLVAPDFKVPAEQEPVVEHYRALLHKSLQPAAVETLHHIVSHYSQNQGPIDIPRWVKAVDLSANRVGLLLCGDLEVAAQVLSREPATVDGASTRDKIKDLLLYMASPRYFAARRFLGLSPG